MVVVVVTTVVLDPLVVAVADTVVLDLTLNVPQHDIPLLIEIILLYLLDVMILTLRVMGLITYHKGGQVREMIMEEVIGKDTHYNANMECVERLVILSFRRMCYIGI